MNTGQTGLILVNIGPKMGKSQITWANFIQFDRNLAWRLSKVKLTFRLRFMTTQVMPSGLTGKKLVQVGLIFRKRRTT